MTNTPRKQLNRLKNQLRKGVRRKLGLPNKATCAQVAEALAAHGFKGSKLKTYAAFLGMDYHAERSSIKDAARKTYLPPRKPLVVRPAYLPPMPKRSPDYRKDEGFYESNEWRQVRYFALRRADGCCQCCGARAMPDNPLHVDHIKPRYTHPELSLDPDNLQVLCVDCNMGKGAWDDTDWRSKTRGETV